MAHGNNICQIQQWWPNTLAITSPKYSKIKVSRKKYRTHQHCDTTKCWKCLRLTFSSDLEEAMLETDKSLSTTKIKFCLQDLQLTHNIYNVSQILEKQVVQMEEFVQLHLQLYLIIEEAKIMVNNAQMYMEHLQLQLNMLSLGHLSPSVITAQSLKRLFLEMKYKLPHHLTLPNDSDRELWKYYQSLTCTTIWDRGMFLVVVLVPLLERDNKFEIYTVINSQLPFYDCNLTVSL